MEGTRKSAAQQLADVVGIIAAGWETCPFVHAVELDLVPGTMKGAPLSRELWGGFALAILEPEERGGPLTIGAAGDIGYRTLWTLSAHNVAVRRVMQLWSVVGGRSGRR